MKLPALHGSAAIDRPALSALLSISVDPGIPSLPPVTFSAGRTVGRQLEGQRVEDDHLGGYPGGHGLCENRTLDHDVGHRTRLAVSHPQGHPNCRGGAISASHRKNPANAGFSHVKVKRWPVLGPDRLRNVPSPSLTSALRLRERALLQHDGTAWPGPSFQSLPAEPRSTWRVRRPVSAFGSGWPALVEAPQAWDAGENSLEKSRRRDQKK
jgi:hypothetical protein